MYQKNMMNWKFVEEKSTGANPIKVRAYFNTTLRCNLSHWKKIDPTKI